MFLLLNVFKRTLLKINKNLQYRFLALFLYLSKIIASSFVIFRKLTKQLNLNPSVIVNGAQIPTVQYPRCARENKGSSS